MTNLSLFTSFVNNMQASSYYKKWKASYANEATAWGLYRDALLAGKTATPPTLTTYFGKSLVNAGQVFSSIPDGYSQIWLKV